MTSPLRVPNLIRFSFLALLLSVCGIRSHAQEPSVPNPSLSELREGFRTPPLEARLRCYWWWLNGNTDAATITHDLEEMKAKGFGGALLVDANGSNQNGNLPVPAGPTFGSPAWVALFTHALAEADRLGLEITFNITSGWNLGGPDVTPAQASKLLTFTRTQVTGGAPVTLKLPDPPASLNYYRQIAVLAYPLSHGAALAEQPDDAQGDRHTEDAASRTQDSARTLRFRSAAAESGFSMPDSSAMLNNGTQAQFARDPAYADTPLAGVIDISANVSAEGALRWSPPPGDWEVLRIGYTASGAKVSTSSGAWQGLAIDYLNHEAFLEYWNHTVEPLLKAAQPYHSLRYLASDSWELGGTNWTPEFRQHFQQLRGYDPIPWLPVVAGRIVGDRAQSTRFLTDLRRTVADLVVSEHYDVFAAKAQEYGLGVEAESGGPHGAPIDALETFRHAAVPQTEFWSQNPHRNTDVARFFTKEGASAANIYGKRFVAQEGETSIGPQWSESLLSDLKPSFDMAITEGMNRLVWHEFTSSPASTGLPGQEYFAGTHLNPKVTWWNAGVAFFTYLNRAQYLMQQGTAVNDVLYFYGDNVPNFVRLKADDPAHVLPGYDYDVTDEDALLHTIHMDGGRLTGPSGVQWKMLALPKTRRISLQVLRRAEAYVSAGGTLAGMPPLSPTGQSNPETMTAFETIVHKVWGNECAPDSHHRYGRGEVFCTADTHAALLAMKIPPDIQIEPSQPLSAVAESQSDLDYIHRRTGSTDVYFIRNGSNHASNHEITFRTGNRAPALWDAVTGDTGAVPPHKLLPDGRVQISLSLAPFGSTFVVFAESIAANRVPSQEPARVSPLVPVRPWSVSFQPNRGAPEEAISVDTLKSWTDWPQLGIRFFSGSATYRTAVEAPKHESNSEVWLNLGEIHEIARVRINGVDAGTIWAKPSSLRVDRFLRQGENTLEVEVTNLWPNRIIGDLQPGTTTRYTSTNITAYKADSPLLPSGMIGPVVWEVKDR